MRRRQFLAAGALSSLGLAACGGGGGGGEDIQPPPAQGLRATGWAPMPPQDYLALPEAGSNFPVLGGFPAFDLSDPEFLARIGWPTFMPSVGDQGQQPSCTAWAVGYTAATQVLMASGSPLSSAISPADLFAKILRRSPNACTSGSLISYAMDTLVQEGVTTLDVAPYFDQQCGLASTERVFNLDGFSRVSAADELSIKGSIQMMQPVSFGMLVSESFMRLSPADAVYVPDGRGSGHAMSVVGYDDERQLYKIMNSWGTGWGAGGLFWMSYVNFAKYATDVCIPYRRRSTDNEILSATASNSTTGITAQHMKAIPTPRGGSEGKFGVGVEMGWSAPLGLSAANISVLDDGQNALFSQDYALNQVARGIRFGARLPDAAANYALVRASVTGIDYLSRQVTLTATTRPYRR